MGRPTKLTPALRERVLANLRSGIAGEVAAQAAGISARTFYCWKARGERESRGPYWQFLQDVKKVEAEVELLLAAQVRQAAASNWQAAMTMLERRWPQRWARHERMDLTLREDAQRIAGPLGLSAAELIQMAEHIVVEHQGER